MGPGGKAVPRPKTIHAALEEKRRQPEAVLEHVGEKDDVIVGMHDCEPATVLDPMVAVATSTLGSGLLYEFVGENPGAEVWSFDQTNNERAVAGEKSFVAVNATMEVDFLGQCASESLGGACWSSPGGQPDFARRALPSGDGQSITVLRSTTADEPDQKAKEIYHL
jgi:acyl-CoA hydrolase